MSIWTALAPALSPRRGSAELDSRSFIRLAASGAASGVEISIFSTAAAVALPLLGERAGVRAKLPSTH